MPGSLVDRLVLPNLKVYVAGSAAALAAAAYHAAGAVAGPRRANHTLPAPGPRNLTEQALDVASYMMQEPLCMWSVINMCYCVLALSAECVRRAVFGGLRAAEAARLRDRLGNYVFYKFIFVFGVVNVQYMDEVLLWCCWFTLLGYLHLLALLCKDRFEYISVWSGGGGAGPARGGGGLARLLWLELALAAGAALLLRAPRAEGHTLAFMAAEVTLVLVSVCHVLCRAALQRARADAAGALLYYTHLAFDSVGLVVEAAHVAHMVWYSRLLLSMPSLVLALQLRHLSHELRLRLRRHRLYTALAKHMSQHYPMASREEVATHQDKCAICWEPMREARKLPCSHLFHNGCLCQWVQQDASCPTCRRALRPRPAPPAPPRPRDHHLFRFDGSRYASWLPSFSVEVTRVRGAPGGEEGGPPPPPRAPAPPTAPPPAPPAAPPALAVAESWAAPPPARPAPPPARPAPHAVTFSGEAAERECSLRRRKEELLCAARRRYLARRPPAAPPAAPAAPAAQGRPQ